MAEACLRLVHGDSKELTGMITYAVDMINDYNLTPVELLA